MNLPKGFTIHEPDDHVVILSHEGEDIATFSQTGATEESIEAECQKHLSENHRED